MKRIGIECHNLEGKRFGVGQTLIQALEQIAETSHSRGADFKFYLYFKKEIPADEILKDPIFVKKIVRLPFLRPSFNIFYQILLPIRYFIDGLSTMFFPGYMLPFLFFGKSIVVLTNDVYYEAHRGSLPFRYRLAYGIFSWWAAKRATRVMTISEFAEAEIADFFKISPQRIFVNPWGLNKKLLNKDIAGAPLANGPARGAPAGAKFSINGDFIFSWGQAFPRRRAKECILAFEKIAADVSNLQYFVACADKYNPPVLADLARQVNRRLGREAIIYCPYIETQEELFCLIAAAKLVVYVSSSEAMGLPPLEALCLGVPSLVADNGLTHEIFEDIAFFVKNPEDVDEIAVKMKQGISDESKRARIVANKDKIIGKFTWEKWADGFYKILEGIS